MDDLVGQAFGNYRLTRLLGEGGFAQVYLGEHVYLGTQAAIKVLELRLGSGEVDAFYREARTIGRLIHPHIVRVLEFGVQDRTPYLVLEYAPHGTLRERYPSGTPVAPDIILPWVQQTAAALQFAHDQQVIHRDVKPENLLLSRDNAVLLSDFGIAIVAQSSQRHTTEEVIGTVAYMAPEQLHGKPRPTSDQYALGVVVYEWLSGRLPFSGTYREMALQHLLADPPSLQDQQQPVSPALEQVVFRALAKKPEDRFASVRAFASAFEEACQAAKEPAMPSPAAPTEHLERPAEALTPIPVELRLPGRPAFVFGKVSRRNALLGLAGLVAAGVGGGELAFWLQRAQLHAPGPMSTPAVQSSPMPSKGAQSNDLFIYRGHQGTIHALAWSPDSKRIASGGDDKIVRVWDATTGEHLIAYHGHTALVEALAWSPNGMYIASTGGDGTVQIWEAATASLWRMNRNHQGSLHAVSWSSNGGFLASGGDDRMIQNWHMDQNFSVGLYDPKTPIWSLAWSPIETLSIAVGTANGGVYLYHDIEGYENPFIYSKHAAAVDTLAWSSDGRRVASGSRDTRIDVWDAFTGDYVISHTNHTKAVSSLSWVPQAHLIASASFDGTVQIWEVTTGATVFTYQGHQGSVWAVAWSPDGTLLASGGADSVVRVWKLDA